MCGVAGFVGLGHLSAEQRFDLTEALGIGIDSRGGDAAGFVSIAGTGMRPVVRLARKLDEWTDARGRFIRAAAMGHSVMMHSRWTTSGNSKDINCAHPFPISRDRGGKSHTVLYGAHNGMLEGTVRTAKQFGRDHTVDSREFLELLADKQYDLIRKLDGYGVVTYVKPSDGIIRVLRLSSNSDFEIVAINGGGMVYASTKAILKDALDFAGLDIARELSVPVPGQVYRIEPQKVRPTNLVGVKVSEYWGKRWDLGGYCGADSSPGYYSQKEREAYGFGNTAAKGEPDNWSYTYKRMWDEKLMRYRWVKVSLGTGEVVDDTGFLEPQGTEPPESGSKLPSEPVPSTVELANDPVVTVMTPPDFDEEQAAEWEQFWLDNQDLLNDRSEKE